MKKILAVIMSLIAVNFMLAGCGSSEEPADSEAAVKAAEAAENAAENAAEKLFNGSDDNITYGNEEPEDGDGAAEASDSSEHEITIYKGESAEVDDEVLDTIVKQYDAMKNNDAEKFSENMNWEFLTTYLFEGQDLSEEELQSNIESLKTEFTQALEENQAAFIDIGVDNIEGLITNIVLVTEDSADDETYKEYSFDIEGTDYIGDFIILGLGDDRLVMLNDIHSYDDEQLMFANSAAGMYYNAIAEYIAENKDDNDSILPLEEQTVSCIDGSGAVNEDLGKAIAAAVSGNDDEKGEIFIGMINDADGEFFVQWRHSEGSQFIGQYPDPSQEKGIIDWGIYTKYIE